MELYLSSIEYKELSEPRKVMSIEQIEINKKFCLKVKIDKPLIGQEYGFGEKNINILYLISRFDNKELKKLISFPIEVYVLISKKMNLSENISDFENLENIAWATLYNNYIDALEKK